MLRDFIYLIFPEYCAACNKLLVCNEQEICTECEFNLPQTNYHLVHENSLKTFFYGRANLIYANAMYFFHKEGGVQNVIHALKYKGQKNIGYVLGKRYGKTLLKTFKEAPIELIIPVPIHHKKKRERGYNQSDFFAKGLSESMNVPICTDILYRSSFSDSQTHKSQFDRWKNVEKAFGIHINKLPEGKHILLVDDVITTGSTIEACTEKLMTTRNNRVSIAAIAHAIT